MLHMSSRQLAVSRVQNLSANAVGEAVAEWRLLLPGSGREPPRLRQQRTFISESSVLVLLKQDGTLRQFNVKRMKPF